MHHNDPFPILCKEKLKWKHINTVLLIISTQYRVLFCSKQIHSYTIVTLKSLLLFVNSFPGLKVILWQQDTIKGSYLLLTELDKPDRANTTAQCAHLNYPNTRIPCFSVWIWKRIHSLFQILRFGWHSRLRAPRRPPRSISALKLPAVSDLSTLPWSYKNRTEK